MSLIGAGLKYVVAPAAATAGISAVPPALDLFTGKSGRKAMDAIGASQAGKLSTEDYDIGLDQQFLNLFRPEADKVTTDNITARENTRNLDAITKDSVLSERLGRLGYEPVAGDTKAKLQAKFGKQFKQQDAEDALQAAITQAAGLAEYKRSTPEYQRELNEAADDKAYRRFI